MTRSDNHIVWGQERSVCLLMDLCHTSIHTVFVFVFVTHFITQSTWSQIHKHIHRRGLCVCWWTFVIHNLIVTVFLYCQHCHTQIQTVLSIILSHRKNTNKGAGLSVCLLIEQTSKHRCTSELCDELHSFRIYQNNWNVELFLSSMLTADLTYNKWWQYSHGQWAEIINIPKYASFKNIQDQRNFRWIEIFADRIRNRMCTCTFILAPYEFYRYRKFQANAQPHLSNNYNKQLLLHSACTT